MTDEQYKKAKQLYLSGWSLSKIGKEFHIDRGRLSQKLKEDGVEIVNKQNQTRMNETFFDNIDSEEKAYWLGFMYADGYVSKTDNGIELSLKSSDFGHLEKFIKSLDFSNKKLFKDSVRCRLTFRNKHMHESLVKQGCVPTKSLILTFPTEEQVPSNLLPHFIRGYVDGDGSVMLGMNHKKEYVKPRLSILGTYEFLNTLIQKTKWKQVKIQHPSNAYSIEWSGKYVEEYLDYLYKDASIYLDRKYKKYLDIKNTIAV